MEGALVYQEKAEYAGKKGTLVLTRRLIKFAVVSYSGQANTLFSVDITQVTPMKRGILVKRLVILDKGSSQEHKVSVAAPDVWVGKIVAVKAERG